MNVVLLIRPVGCVFTYEPYKHHKEHFNFSLQLQGEFFQK